VRTVSEWVGALVIGLYPKRRVAGIRVIYSDTSVDRVECGARIERATAAVSAAGERYRALMKRIKYMVVWPGNRTFADSSGGVHIASEDLLGIDDLALASVLVHEAVHLRISARGIKFLPAVRERIERRCIAEQARFLRRHGGIGEQMAQEAEAVLAFPWWTVESREAELQQLLDTHRIPRWVRPILPRS
jgi:hypothetical protein